MHNMLQYVTIYQVTYWAYLNIFFVIFCIPFAYFLSYSAYFLAYFLAYSVYWSKQVRASFCSAVPNLKSLWVEALMWFCNPQEADSGSIREAAARSSVTGNRCWSSGTGRHYCRVRIGALLITGKHVILPSIHQWDLMKLLQKMQNAKMQNVPSMKNVLNMLKFVKYAEYAEYLEYE